MGNNTEILSNNYYDQNDKNRKNHIIKYNKKKK